MTNTAWIISSCVLILAVIGVRAVFGKRMRPGLRYALWGLVLLRLLYPGSVLSSPISVQNIARQTSVTRVETAARYTAPASETKIPESAESRGTVTEHQTVTVKEEERVDAPKAEAKPADIVKTVWIAGIGAAAVFFFVSNLRFYLKLRRRRKLVSAECPLRVYSVDNLSSSCLFGNAVYVSSETAKDGEKLKHVLAHELSHYRHGDHVWTLLRSAALVIHWYNPLVWWAAALSRQDSELCADAGALKRLGEEEREKYGSTLIELSAGRAARVSLLCTATTMTNGKRSLKERVTMIASRPRMTVAVVLAVAIVLSVAAGCAFTGAKEEQKEPEETADSTPEPEPKPEPEPEPDPEPEPEPLPLPPVPDLEFPEDAVELLIYEAAEGLFGSDKRQGSAFTLTMTDSEENRQEVYELHGRRWASGMGCPVADKLLWDSIYTVTDSAQGSGRFTFLAENEDYAIEAHSGENSLRIRIRDTEFFFADEVNPSREWGTLGSYTFGALCQMVAQPAEQEYGVTVPASVEDPEEAVRLLAEGWAARSADRPAWALYRAERALPGTWTILTETHRGAEVSFSFGTYIEVTEEERTDWDTGPGLPDQISGGEYDGMFLWGIGADAVRDEDGTWRIGGMWTGF